MVALTPNNSPPAIASRRIVRREAGLFMTSVGLMFLSTSRSVGKQLILGERPTGAPWLLLPINVSQSVSGSVPVCRKTTYVTYVTDVGTAESVDRCVCSGERPTGAP